MKYYKNLRIISAISILVISGYNYAALAQPKNIMNTGNNLVLINSIEVYQEQRLGNQNSYQIIHNNNFDKFDGFVSGFGSLWLRFSITNHSNDSNVCLLIQNPEISIIQLYKDSAGQLIQFGINGNSLKTSKGIFDNPNYVFNLHLNPNDSNSFYIYMSSANPAFLHMFGANFATIQNWLNIQTNTTSLLIGIIVALFSYNIFLFMCTYDLVYFYFATLVFFGGFAQLTTSGYTFLLFWNNHPSFNKFSIPIGNGIVYICYSLFTITFLQTRRYSKFGNWILHLSILLYLIAISLSFISNNSYSLVLMNLQSMIISIIMLIVCIQCLRKGFKQAYFYLFSWVIYATVIIVTILINFKIIQYDKYLVFLPYISLISQFSILAIPLANRINILLKENKKSQTIALQIANENATLIKEQNLFLEEKLMKGQASCKT